MGSEPRRYRAYLLRFWRDDDRSPWRATLEDPHTGQAFGFASMAQLYAFLDEQAGRPDDDGNGNDPGSILNAP